MGRSQFLFVFLVSILLSSWSYSSIENKASINCAEVQVMLKGMLKAQNSLLTSMVDKNDAFANTLDGYASDFSKMNRKIGQRELVSMKSSATTIRKHKNREAELVKKFTEKSTELESKILYCMSASKTTNTKRNAYNK